MINNMVLQGRLCAEPELRQTPAGVAVCSFRVANSKKYKEQESKLFLNCTAWRGLGEMVAKYFVKGQEIVVQGEMWSRDWEDKEGNKRTSIEMTVNNVSFCGSKGAEGCNSVPAGGYAAPVTVSADDFEDDGTLPF